MFSRYCLLRTWTPRPKGTPVHEMPTTCHIARSWSRLLRTVRGMLSAEPELVGGV